MNNGFSPSDISSSKILTTNCRNGDELPFLIAVRSVILVNSKISEASATNLSGIVFHGSEQNSEILKYKFPAQRICHFVSKIYLMYSNMYEFFSLEKFEMALVSNDFSQGFKKFLSS